MALLTMAVYDTEENGRTKYTERTLWSIDKTIDFTKHRLIVVDNNSCKDTQDLLFGWLSGKNNYKVIRLPKNIGTAEAINIAWKERLPGEHCIKIDNDVVINSKDWIEQLEEVIERDKRIGQVGLKRKDLLESPTTEGFYKSELYMLPHEKGQKWIVVEKCNHIMGTCVMHSSKLLDKVGYLYQPGIYGFDDALMSHRSKIAGFTNVFLPNIDIDHIDTGENLYQKEKEKLANKDFPKYEDILKQYNEGTKSIYYNPYETNNNNN